jgi:hypothetical protein
MGKVQTTSLLFSKTKYYKQIKILVWNWNWTRAVCYAASLRSSSTSSLPLLPSIYRSSPWPKSIFGGADPRSAGNGKPPRRGDMLRRCVIDADAGTNQNAVRLRPVQYFQPTWEGKQITIGWTKLTASASDSGWCWRSAKHAYQVCKEDGSTNQSIGPELAQPEYRRQKSYTNKVV